MPTKSTLPPNIHERLAGLGEAIGSASSDVLFAYLFGSASTEQLTPHSDVDIAVYVAPGADTHAARLVVLRAASRQLGTDAIDVVVLNGMRTALVGRVLGSRQVLLDREPFTRHQFESLQGRMFQDFRIRERRLLAARHAHG